MELPDKLLRFLDEVREPLPPVRDPDEELHIDSLALLKVVAFLETDLGITVADNQLLVDNFVNLRAISNLLNGGGVRMGPSFS